ncbi:hypothetical protein GPUN_0026 [Glaciecola punicea ACAM 611]|uniref:Uncharacterized protein n=1 Tax=Glaciecola punicea ACAM 611 TaxID=1121923 RepID=H5T7A3_9ALTE|nr:hypothetical protein GPUN_0026 [Glaciecola punicea ACAM 611]
MLAASRLVLIFFKSISLNMNVYFDLSSSTINGRTLLLLYD